MVKGYPIAAKRERSLGLEIPLNMMAGLIGTNQIMIFDQKSFVKGFSAMVVAVRLTKDLLVWHYNYNENGERISYNDLGMHAQKADNISPSEVPTLRHIVGWCTNCVFNAGTSRLVKGFKTECINDNTETYLQERQMPPTTSEAQACPVLILAVY